LRPPTVTVVVLPTPAPPTLSPALVGPLAAAILMRCVTEVVWLLVRRFAGAAAALPRSRLATELVEDIVGVALPVALLDSCGEVATDPSGMMLPHFVIASVSPNSFMTIAAIIVLVKVTPKPQCWEGMVPGNGPNARPLAATRGWWASVPRAPSAMGLAHARRPAALR
jgi:hypothetical protein